MAIFHSTEPAAPLPHPADSLTDEQLEAIARADLENILREVELARQVVQTCAQALHHMNVDESDEVANVLMRHGSDALVGPCDALREILSVQS
jgi:hypothetical protein